MLRSQSINSLGEHRRNKSSSFFSAFRSKRNQQEVQANDAASVMSSFSRHSRRSLSTNISVFNLSELQAEDYDENKENIYEHNLVKEKHLRPRSSAPMLNKLTPTSATTSTTNSLATSKFYSTSRKSIRSSMFILAKSGSRQLLQHPQEIQIHNNQSPESTLTETTPNSLDINVDSIFDQSSITCGDSENDDFSLSSSSTRQDSPNGSPKLTEQSPKFLPPPTRLHRTINSYNINEFMKGIHDDDVNKRLPISNRKSIEIEKKEIENLKQKLNQTSPTDLNSNISLVGNIVFLTSNCKSTLSESSYFVKDLDDINYLDVLTNEDYINYTLIEARDDQLNLQC